MSNFVIVDNDKINIIAPPPIKLTKGVLPLEECTTEIPATGHATIDNFNVCVQGDEKNVELIVDYILTGFPTPGTLKLGPDESESGIDLTNGHIASYAYDNKKLILANATMFDIRLKVIKAAETSQKVKDPTSIYTVKGNFIAQKNNWVTVS